MEMDKTVEKWKIVDEAEEFESENKGQGKKWK